MRVKILLFIAIVTASVNVFSKNKEPKQEEKKTQKAKYDFTIFKLFSINSQNTKTDSSKTILINTHLKKED